MEIIININGVESKFNDADKAIEYIKSVDYAHAAMVDNKDEC